MSCSATRVHRLFRVPTTGHVNRAHSPRRGTAAVTSSSRRKVPRSAEHSASAVLDKERAPGDGADRTEERQHGRAPLVHAFNVPQIALHRAHRPPPGSSSVSRQRSTRSLPPPASLSTSAVLTIFVSPGVVITDAPWAAPYSTAVCNGWPSSRPKMSPDAKESPPPTRSRIHLVDGRGLHGHDDGDPHRRPTIREPDPPRRPWSRSLARTDGSRRRSGTWAASIRGVSSSSACGQEAPATLSESPALTMAGHPDSRASQRPDGE